MNTDKFAQKPNKETREPAFHRGGGHFNHPIPLEAFEKKTKNGRQLSRLGGTHS